MTRVTSGRGVGPPLPVPDTVLFAVVAAHRTGQPLHHELASLGARFAGCAATAPVYRMVALPGPGVARGGLVPVGSGGARIEVELHRMPPAGVDVLGCALPAPLVVGEVRLEDGTSVAGLVCTERPDGALDVSGYGSWPAFLAATRR